MRTRAACLELELCVVHFCQAYSILALRCSLGSLAALAPTAGQGQGAAMEPPPKKRGRPPKHPPASQKKTKLAAAATPQPTAATSTTSAQVSAALASMPTALQKANASHYAEVENAINVILADDILRCIKDAKPLQLSEGGRAARALLFCTRQIRNGVCFAVRRLLCEFGVSWARAAPAPTKVSFDQAAFQEAISGGSDEFQFLGNLFWQDFLHSPTYGAPINKTSVADIRNRHLPIDNPPEQWAIQVVVGVPDSASPLPFGALKRLSPEEFQHAALFACRDAIAKNVGDDVKRRWLKFFRNQMFTRLA